MDNNQRPKTSTERYQQRVRDHLCTDCGVPLTDGRHQCEKCRKARRDYQKNRRDTFRASGRCIFCGRKAECGRVSCSACLRYHSDRVLDKYYRDKAKREANNEP